MISAWPYQTPFPLYSTVKFLPHVLYAGCTFDLMQKEQWREGGRIVCSIYPVYLLLKEINMLAECLPERQLETDLDRLIGHMRTHEDSFLTLATHIHALLQPNDALLFVHEQVANSRTLAERIRRETAAGEVEYGGVVQRWASKEGVGEEGVVLMKRVAYRLLEVFFGSINTINNKIPQLLHDYLRLKITCQKILLESGSRPHLLIKAITDYEFKKLRKYVDLLGELANHLQNGDIDTFSKFQIGSYLQNRPSNRDIPTQAKSLFNSTFKISKAKVREKQSSKPEIMLSEKVRSPHARKLRAIYQNLKDVMDINRQELLDEFSYREIAKDTILRDLLTRNKANQQVIQDFHSKKRRIQHKLKNGISGRTAETIQPDSQGENSEENKGFTATRKNLLLKLRNNEKKGLPSELFKKTASKFDEVRTRMKSYNRERLEERMREGKGDAVRCENEEQVAQLAECSESAPMEDRLPLLNKRAHSVDQNYKLSFEGDSPQARTLSNSLKINEQLRIKTKMEKVEMHPAKIKLQLKSFNAVTTLQVSKKLGKMGEFSKYLYF